tara:strand:- start:2462 stop:4003 length:1542 start_codon:yes stop_codon:yes gene_type:complete
MAIIDLKSNLSRIRKPKSTDITQNPLPRTNFQDSRGNTTIEFTDKNKFQINSNPEDSRLLRLHNEDNFLDNLYAQGKKTNSTLGIRNDKFGSTQPYIIRDIGDKWGPDGGFFSNDIGLVRGGAGTLVDRTANDVIRIGKFLLDRPGFTVKQIGLQSLNVGGDLGQRANIYNPLSPLINAVPVVHTKRHTDIPIASDLIREKFIGDTLSKSDGFGSDKRNARFVKPEFSLGSLLGLSKDKGNEFKRLESFRVDYREDGNSIKKKSLFRFQQKVNRTNGKDYVNLIPYGGLDSDKLSKSDNADFIPFRFKDVTNNKYLVFRAILSGITDTVTPEYTSERYVGRPDKAYVYQGTDREISFTFDVYPKSRQELVVLWDKLNYLVGMCYPSYAKNNSMGMGMVAPFCELTIGDMFKNTPGYLGATTLTVNDGTTWEIDDYKLPKYIQVNTSFTYIGKYLPNQVGKHYEFPWLVDTNFPEGVGTFSENPQTESYPLRFNKPIDTQTYEAVSQPENFGIE